MNEISFKKTSRRLVIELAVVIALVGYKINFPHNVSASEAWKFVFHHPPVLLHVVVASLIVLEALVFVVRALRSKRWEYILGSLLGLAFVALAFAAGERYVAGQNLKVLDRMSMGWFGAIVVYGVCWYVGRRQVRAQAK